MPLPIPTDPLAHRSSPCPSRCSPESALLMLHWQNSVADPKGVWGKNLYPQIEKNNSIKNAQKVLKLPVTRAC